MCKRTIIAVLILLVAMPTVAEDTKSRFGTLTIKKESIYLNGSIKLFEGNSLEIVKVLNGKTKDYIVVVSHSGGIACPSSAFVIEIVDQHNHRTSDALSSCSPRIEAHLEGESVVVEIARYVAHPKELTKDEQLRIEATKDIFTWADGKLTQTTSGGPEFKYCFPGLASTTRPPDVLIAESKKRAEDGMKDLIAIQIDLNKDQRPDWFIATGVGSSAVGKYGDVYLYYKNSDKCPGTGYCYAGSGLRLLIETSQTPLHCESAYRDL